MSLTCIRRMVILLFLLVFFCAIAPSISLAQDTMATAQNLMDRISASMVAQSSNGRKPEDAGASRDDVLKLRDQLGALDAEAVPAIEDRINSENDTRIRSEFTFSLGMIPGEKVDRILLSMFCSEQDVATIAGMQLARRRERFGPLTFAIPEEQIEKLISKAGGLPGHDAANALCVLGTCTNVSVKPILCDFNKKFVREIKAPPGTIPQPMSYVSPRVYKLNNFLLAFEKMREIVRPGLREELEKAWRENDKELAKWFSMALGLCQDSSVADYLKEVVIGEEDRYVRCTAIRCYAKSADERSIPVLRTLLNDVTTSEYESCFGAPYLLIQGAARAELCRIVQKHGSVDSKHPISNEELLQALDEIERCQTQ